MQTTFRTTLAASAAALATLAVGPTAGAGVITFDPADGYPLGTSLVGKPTGGSPQWAGNGALYSITSLGGGNGAASSAASPSTAFANNRYTPTAAFLGTPTTDTAGQTYDYSFLLRNDTEATATGFGVAHRIRIGGTDGAPIIQFQVFDNGVLQYNNGGTSVSVNNVNGNRLDLDDVGTRFIPVAGTIDFTTNTYSVTVDGVAQGTGIAVINAPATFGQYTLQAGNSTSSPVFRQITIDNLATTAQPVPEPAAVAGVAAISGLLLRRRR